MNRRIRRLALFPFVPIKTCTDQMSMLASLLCVLACFQTLYVRVVEGRGLMASDLNGKSDPYVKLCLTGRCENPKSTWRPESANLNL